MIFGFQLDGHPGAVVQVDPFDAVLLDVFGPLLARWNVDAVASAIENLGMVFLRIDLNLVVVSGLARETFEMILTGLPVVSTPYMPAGLMPIPC